MIFGGGIEQYESGDDPAGACNRAIASVKAKADRNESVARGATWVLVLAGALIPVSIIVSTQGSSFWWGQLLPGLLGVLTAAVAGVLQFDRPHERWRFYRGYQRQLETERLQFETRSGPYAGFDQTEAEAVLVRTLAELQHRRHEEWEALVPSSSEVAGSTQPAGQQAGSGAGDAARGS
jgi:hypothetical protein